LAGLRLQRLAEEEMDRGSRGLRERPKGKRPCVLQSARNNFYSAALAGTQHRQSRHNELEKIYRKFIATVAEGYNFANR
jgi:hypothetical protein